MAIRIVLTLCFLLNLLSGMRSYAQQLSFRYLGADQGMKTIGSFHSAIDQHHFIWVATNDGLARFNGKDLMYYYHQTHPGLPADQIGFIFCDSRNHVWVCTDKGLAHFDENRKVVRQIIDPDKPDEKVWICFEDGEGLIYARCGGSFYSLTNKTSMWQREPWLDSLTHGSRPRDIRRMDKDRYVFNLEGTGVSVINLKSRSNDAYIPVKNVSCAIPFDSAHLLIGLAEGGFQLALVGLDTPHIQRKIPPPVFFKKDNHHARVFFMTRAADGHIYASTLDEGVVSLDRTLTRYQHYIHDPVKPETIINNSMRYAVSDTSGLLIFTSLDGVNYTNVFNRSVESINYLYLDNHEIIDKRAISMAEDSEGNIWVCLKDEVLIYDPRIKRATRLNFPAGFPMLADEISPLFVTRDLHNDMWVSIQGVGILVYDKNRRFRRMISEKEYPEFGQQLSIVRVMADDHAGHMYLGTYSGLMRLKYQDWTIDTFPNDEEMKPLRKGERITDILVKPNELWVSSSPGGGAWHYSFEIKKLKKFNSRNGLATDRVYGLAKGPNESIYVGSYNGFSIIYTNDSVSTFMKGEGLLSNRIESIESSEDGAAWMTNNYTLVKYVPEEEKFYSLTGRHGVSGFNFAILSSTRLASGKLVFGVNKGFIIVDPDYIELGKDSLKVYVFYKDVDGNEMEIKDDIPLHFSYKQSNVRFLFAVNDMMIADQVSFRYRMVKDGSEAWSTPSLNSSVDFNLDPGFYSLEVEAYDGQDWYRPDSLIQFKINPPWWRQWWFITLMALTFVTSVFFYFRRRIDKYKHELKVARQIAELESKALRAQMNPHFVFNSLNAIQECIVTGRVEEAYSYLSKFSKLLRMVLEHSDVSEVSLQEELEVLHLYVSLEKLRFKDDMKYEFQLRDELDPDEIFIPPLLIQPHLENAIWHGLRYKEGKKLLKLILSENPEGYLEVLVEDDGIGRKKAWELRQARMGGSKHKSMGSQLSESRMVLLRNNYPHTAMEITDLFHENQQPAGTKVKLTIPMVENKSIIIQSNTV